jgi:hypothetical protein
MLYGQSPDTRQAGDIDAQEPQIFTTEVKEVQIPFSVFDRRGNLQLDLKQEEFRVFEDGVEQKVNYFNAPTNLPVTIRHSHRYQQQRAHPPEV